MSTLATTIWEIAPPKDSAEYRKVEQAMVAAGIGPLTIEQASNQRELGATHLGGTLPGRLLVEFVGVSLGSGGELYSALDWEVAVVALAAGQQGETQV